MAEKPRKRILKSGKVSWEARYRDPSGRIRSKSFPTKKAADTYLEEENRNVRRGEWIDPKDQEVTIGELMQAWADRSMRDGTRQAYLLTKKNLGRLEHTPAALLLRTDVDAWHRQLRSGRPWMSKGDKGLAPSTAREHVVRLSVVLNSAVEDRIILRNVVKLPRIDDGAQVLRSDVPSIESIQKVVAQLQAGGAEHHVMKRVKGSRTEWEPGVGVQQPQPVIAAMVGIAIGSGLRLSELCALRKGDVDLLRREIRVEAQLSANGKERVPTKTATSVRIIPVADDLLEVVDRQLRGAVNGWVFETKRGTPYRAASAGAELRKAVRFLGEDLTFHSFRHFFATKMISSGVSVKQVQRVMGHASAATTLDVYAHFFPGDDDLSRSAVFGVVESCKIFARFSPGSVSDIGYLPGETA
ncbi:tyrosine-type recombinase/integrase [Corynebacterium glutamicum]|uniref:tyrosine-type recombinase/integrase n=1 Tax=Corynebacterium glutamicum TaxID=1718 RepID=UPI000744D55B|nr:site-specific integrase [Corynebacterium glutamicum]AMA00252.1 hypothetical protein APT58_08455 [Corynebacterium glutamicum]